METTPLLRWFNGGEAKDVKPEEAKPVAPPKHAEAKPEEIKLAAETKQRFDDYFPIKKLTDEEAEASFHRAFRYDRERNVLCVVSSKHLLSQTYRADATSSLGYWYGGPSVRVINVSSQENLTLGMCSIGKPRTFNDAVVEFEDVNVPCVYISTKSYCILIAPRNGWTQSKLVERLVDLLFPMA